MQLTVLEVYTNLEQPLSNIACRIKIQYIVHLLESPYTLINEHESEFNQRTRTHDQRQRTIALSKCEDPTGQRL